MHQVPTILSKNLLKFFSHARSQVLSDGVYSWDSMQQFVTAGSS